MAKWIATESNKLIITMDISTYCNAGCPQCHRTSTNGLGKEDWLPLVQWSLEDFKKAFPTDQFKYISKMSFVGSWGDSVMNKDIFEIVKYVIDNGTYVVVETNGGMRDEEWWWKFGLMGGNRLSVRFDIDGINQQMHSKYRRFTNLDKVLNHMYTLSQTHAIPQSQTVVFKHNQDYLKEIEELCFEYGSLRHTKVISDRFGAWETNDKGQYEFINENGELEILEEADRNVLSDKAIITGTTKNTLDENIYCRWSMPRNEILIKPDGSVVPCCYIGNGYWQYLQDGNDRSKYLENKTMKDFIDNKEKYNVFNYTIKEIVDSEWYQKTLPASMKSDKPIHTCERNCSNRIRETQQIREATQIQVLNVL